MMLQANKNLTSYPMLTSYPIMLTSYPIWTVYSQTLYGYVSVIADLLGFLFESPGCSIKITSWLWPRASAIIRCILSWFLSNILDKDLVCLNSKNQESIHLGMGNIIHFRKPFWMVKLMTTYIVLIPEFHNHIRNHHEKCIKKRVQLFLCIDIFVLRFSPSLSTDISIRIWHLLKFEGARNRIEIIWGETNPTNSKHAKMVKYRAN